MNFGLHLLNEKVQNLTTELYNCKIELENYQTELNNINTDHIKIINENWNRHFSFTHGIHCPN